MQRKESLVVEKIPSQPLNEMNRDIMTPGMG